MFVRITTGIFALLYVSIASAFTLDWDQVDWAQGDEQHTFYNVQGSGIDVTISLNLSKDSATYRNGWWGGYRTTTDWINDAPNDNTTFGGDWGAENGESLYLGLDFATDDLTKSYLDVTISFSQPVLGASFDLFDVDAYGYNYQGGYETGIQFVDIIEHIEGSNNGSNVGSGNVGYYDDKINAVTHNGETSYYGDTSLTNSNDQNDNPHSTLSLNWGSQTVDSVSFRYSPGSAAVRDPGTQAIGLSDISFYAYNAVPEAGTILLGGLSGLLLLGLAIHRQVRKPAVS